jgi:hypothetical protein
MKNFFLLFIISLGLIGCSSMELEPVSSSKDETLRILAMNLSHEENLKEASKLSTPHMVSVVSLQLTNAKADKIKSESNLAESEKFAEMVKISSDGSKFTGSLISKTEKIGILDLDTDKQSFYIEGTKDAKTGFIAHQLYLSIVHNSKEKRNYSSVNFCDDWGRCNDNSQVINVTQSLASNCNKNSCDYKELIELTLNDELLKSSTNKGIKISFNYKMRATKVNISSPYLRGYLKFAK